MANERLLYVNIVAVREAWPAVVDALSALRILEATRRSATERTVEVEGWLPESWLPELRRILEGGTGGRAAVEVDAETAPVEVPALLSNPRAARPFEFLTELFSLPGRSDIDPTLVTFLLLPAFMGFALGDVGKGLVLLAAGAAVRWRVPTPLGRWTGTLLVYGGLWSTLFGAVLFGEFFGVRLPWLPFGRPLLEKTHDVLLLLGLSLAVGVAHIALGLCMGFVAERRRAGLRMAVLHKLSWLLVEAGLVTSAVALLLGLVPVALPIGLAVLAVGIALVGVGAGVTGLLEVPAFLGHLMSYLRLGAIALAEGVFTMALNQVVAGSIQRGEPVAVALGVVGLAVGHLVLLGLAAVVVAFQAVRLHYVEFYSTFYAPSGVHPFRPGSGL